MRFFLLFFCFTLSSANHALSLRADFPPRYVVQNGDTLWNIASRYLKNPWEWKALWHANPHIKNPNRLYPGAILILDYYKSTPYIRVLSNGTIKLSPDIRAHPLDDAIPPIPLNQIRPFLDASLILDEDVLFRAPYVVAYMGERMLGGQGDEVYVKGLHPSRELPQGGTIAYSLFRGGENYVDPINKKILGFKAALVGYGELIAGGEPATVLLTNIRAGIKIDDKVLINDSPEFDFTFEPATPTNQVKGYIIELPDGMPDGNSQSAIGSVAIISIGAESGLKSGDVLGIFKKERVIPDSKHHLIPIVLPPERIGEAMIFRVFTKTSFALIVRSTRPVYLHDVVSNP
ncbi:LysM peptidoglycan-binding domain-containing protein [Legionella antarctica]|uniref:LysM peptidoglycan-binding domain-containing protein n=1 Tax=Legionella antarctica TaxID=2708020 RepID=UPI001565023C|nr:LysM domain-containing protein [Legionella antarctica]